MKQIIQSYRTGKLQLVDVPLPLCRDQGVLIRTEASLVSAGTERAMIDLARKTVAAKAASRPDLVKQVMDKVREEGVISTAKKVFIKLDSPVALGYSCSGQVIEVGKNVTEFKVGDIVACGGAGYASHAEVNFVPGNLCVKIPDGVSFNEAAFVTLGTIAMQGIRRCQLTPGEKVAVIGLGLIGQLTVQILTAYGFCVLGIDIDEKKVSKSMQWGLKGTAVLGKDNIEAVADAFSDGHGLDAVLITAASKSNQPVVVAGKIARQRGRVIAVGSVGMEIPRDIYYTRELDFRISRSYGPGRYDVQYEEKGVDYPYAYVRWTERRNMEEVLRLISDGRIDVRALVSHTFKLQDYQKAYELILENQGGQEYAGIVLEYTSAKDYKSVIVFSDDKGDRERQKSVVAGLIGGGNFAQSIMLPRLRKLKKLHLRAVATAIGESAEGIGRKYKCDYCTTDYQRILDDARINTVFIATRHNLHAKIAVAALQKNKNVFVEKPLCINETELREIVSVYQSLITNHQSPILMVGFNRRFAPAVVKAKKRFTLRGTPLMINYRINAGYLPLQHWVHDLTQGGGRIVGEVCHFVDLLGYLTSSSPVKLYATSLPQGGSVLADDNLSVVIDFADGSRGNILYTAIGDKKLSKEHIEIFGNRDAMVIDNFRTGRFLGQDKGHFRQWEVFSEAVVNREFVPMPVEEIFLTTLATFKIHHSLQTGRAVNIDLGEVMNK